MKNAPIPPMCVPKEMHNLISKLVFPEGAAQLRSLISENDTSPLKKPWPQNIAVLVGENIYDGLNLLQAWQLVTPAMIVGILDTIRNRILNFVLEIESAAPDAGEGTLPPTFTPEKVGNVFHTNIYGNVANLAAGGTDFKQETTITVAREDWDSLCQYLMALDISPDDIQNLKEAIKKEPKAKSSRFGKGVGAWIGDMVSKSVQGLWKVSAPIASTLLTKAISQYYGLPS